MERDYSKVIDNLVNEMLDDDSATVGKVRDALHQCVDESCDQRNLDAADYKLDAAEAST